MRRLGFLLGGLVLLALAALWIGPGMVNWEAWRSRLAQAASDRLGRPVTLDGPVEVEFLPRPVVRAGGVTIAEPPGLEAEAGFRVTARMLRVQLDLGAFIAGRIVPRDIALVGAELTLPWPPGLVLAMRPPAWISQLDARVEDGRVRLGDTVLEGVTARLTSGGQSQAIEVAGNFTVSGRAARFAATLGRPGWDGITPLELSLTMPEATGRARGVLVPDGGFEGTMEASGPDLAALLPSPQGAFRASGRLTAAADLIAADDLTIDLAGAPARGALALRLVPAPRLDVALIASRIELDGWVAALRGGGARPWPVSIDLSAEAAGYAGMTLRRLRGAAFIEEGRLTLSDISVLLPGETELDFAGTTAGGRLEIGARFKGPDIRATLAALGLPVETLDPALLRRGEGRFRLVLEEAQAAVPELSASFEDLRLSGAGTFRYGQRPALGLGLTVDRLDLGQWMPRGLDLAAAGRLLGSIDVNLRLAAERARWGEAVLERAALDAAVEGGRITLRRLSGKLAEADIVASGTLALQPQLRLQDLVLEANGPAAHGLTALIPGGWPDRTPLAALPVSLRLTGGGTPDALALRGAADFGELRAEVNGTIDLTATKGTATLTLRHPGAPRLLSEAFGTALPWLGEGSFSFVGHVAAGPQGLSADSFELVAGELRVGGQLSLAAGPRPKLTGRLAAERLPLPLPPLRGTEPLGLDVLADFDADLALEAARIEAQGAVFEQGSATLKLEAGQLRLEQLRARLDGGTLEGTARLAIGQGAPRLGLDLTLAEATLAGPLLGLPYDISAGRGEISAQLTAEGHAPVALLGTLSGTWRAALRDGVLTGFDLGAVAQAATLPELPAALAAARRALEQGATGFDALEVRGVMEAGQLRIENGRVTTESGASATLSGSADLARGTVDLQMRTKPDADAPELGLRVTGPATAPHALPETADWARWRAERS